MTGYDISKLFNLKRNPDGSIQAGCPVCRNMGHDKTGNHLRIYPNGAYHCIVGREDREHSRAIYTLLRDPNAEMVEFIEPIRTTAERIYPEDSLLKLVPDYSYWAGRGMKEEIVKKLECGVAPKEEKSKLSGRTVFPIRDLQGRIMGFSGRLLEANSFAPKWKHVFKAGKAVYPWNVTGPDIIASKTCVLVESIGDLMALLSHDIKPVLCIFGLNLNGHIISTLVGHDIQRIIISLNRDDDPNKGQAAAEKIRGRLENFFSNVQIRLPSVECGCKDWGKCAEGGETGAKELVTFREEIG